MANRALVYVPTSVLVDVLRTLSPDQNPPRIRHWIEPELPEDFTVVYGFFDPGSNGFQLVVEHPTFPEVQEGNRPDQYGEWRSEQLDVPATVEELVDEIGPIDTGTINMVEATVRTTLSEVLAKLRAQVNR